jgi:nitric oxide dioxygenase
MAPTERQLELVRDSFAELRKDPRPRFVEFYEAFFRRAPELRSMFREDDLGGQGMRFMSTLGVIVDDLNRPEALEDRLTELGQAHRAMGVKAAHFEPMGAALLETLENTLGADFTPEARAAWEAAYAQVADEIIRRGDIPPE